MLTNRWEKYFPKRFPLLELRQAHYYYIKDAWHLMLKERSDVRVQ